MSTVMHRVIGSLALTATVVFVAASLGIATRHVASISSFWPANAVLLGLMVRLPRLNHVTGWAGAAMGYLAADLMFGRPLAHAVLLTCANLAGVLVGTTLLARLNPRDLSLRRPNSVLNILACILPACLASGVVAALIVVPIVFHGPVLKAIFVWPTSELVNYLTVLPVILTIGPLLRERRRTPGSAGGAQETRQFTPWPALALLLSCVIAVLVGGPGAIMFPMPGLLWCALSYTLPVTALLSMALGAGSLMTAGLGLIDLGYNMELHNSFISLRISVAFMMLVPLTISSAMAARDDLLVQLRHNADHDGLTGLLNRLAFDMRLRQRLDAARGSGTQMVLILLDIDHFKRINDSYGHPAGDAVLRAFADIMRQSCREDDLVGRIGGEEFALATEVSDRAEAALLAERLRIAFATMVTLYDGMCITSTMSIGIGHITQIPHNVDRLVQQVDKALYRAKRNGRNRIEWVDDTPLVTGPSEPPA